MSKRQKNAGRQDEEDDNVDSDDDNNEDGPPQVIVQTSRIPQAGQGLFLQSPRFVPAGTVLLEEQAVAIRRPAAKVIMNLPAWRGRHACIQSSGNRFLDIRLLQLYKANHCASSSRSCNVEVSQTGPAQLSMTARRGIYRGEELLWEYSASQPDFDGAAP